MERLKQPNQKFQDLETDLGILINSNRWTYISNNILQCPEESVTKELTERHTVLEMSLQPLHSHKLMPSRPLATPVSVLISALYFLYFSPQWLPSACYTLLYLDQLYFWLADTNQSPVFQPSVLFPLTNPVDQYCVANTNKQLTRCPSVCFVPQCLQTVSSGNIQLCFTQYSSTRQINQIKSILQLLNILTGSVSKI